MKTTKNNFKEVLLFILSFGASVFAAGTVLILLIFTLK